MNFQSGLRAGLLAVSAMLLILPMGCARKDDLNFPEYKPTRIFLARQELVQRWAREIREKREIEVRLNIAKGRTKTYREWKPIYRRIENYQDWLRTQRLEE